MIAGIWRHRVRTLYRELGLFSARDLSERYDHDLERCYQILGTMRRRGELAVLRRGPARGGGYVRFYAPVLGPRDLT